MCPKISAKHSHSYNTDAQSTKGLRSVPVVQGTSVVTAFEEGNLAQLQQFPLRKEVVHLLHLLLLFIT